MDAIFLPCYLVVANDMWQKVKLFSIPEKPGLQFLRGLMLTLATLFFFAAIVTNDIPEALTLLFISPLIVAVLSPFILGERFDIFIGVGVLIGFIGVIVVLQPDSDHFYPTLLFALVSGFCYSLYIIITKKIIFSCPTSFDFILFCNRWNSYYVVNCCALLDNSRFKGRSNGGSNGFFLLQLPTL